MIGIGSGWSGRGTTNLIFVSKDGRTVPATATTNRRREQVRVLRELADLRPDLPLLYFEAPQAQLQLGDREEDGRGLRRGGGEIE